MEIALLIIRSMQTCFPNQFCQFGICKQVLQKEKKEKWIPLKPNRQEKKDIRRKVSCVANTRGL
jgi:hypothetical protein